MRAEVKASHKVIMRYKGQHLGTVRQEDVGRSSWRRWHNLQIGRFLEIDVDKQVWLQSGIAMIENNEQRDMRLRKGEK